MTRLVLPVDDPADPRLAVFLHLRDHQLRRAREAPGGDLDGICIAEGALVVERALAAGLPCLGVLVDAADVDKVPPLGEGVPIYAASPALVRQITGYHVHRGPLAALGRPRPPAATDVVAGRDRVLVLEGVANPTNLGVIVRSAIALGWQSLLVDPWCCDPLYRRAARVAMGEVYRLPWARCAPLPDGLDVLRAEGFQLVALTPSGDTPIDHVPEPPTGRRALVLGAEGDGLSAATLEAADVRAKIPMHAGVDSLNVGAATSIACWTLGPRAT